VAVGIAFMRGAGALSFVDISSVPHICPNRDLSCGDGRKYE